MSETLEPETGEMIVKRVSVPIGLEELMEGLTKEVLLKKPDDIYVFAAEYFSRLLLLREKGPYKVKTLKTAQSAVKQMPKQPVEKLLIRGASKQLSRQISVRGESPTKRVAPIRRPPARMGREDRDTERNKYIDRRNRAKRTEGAETKKVESKPKQMPVTPRNAPQNSEEKFNNFNKRDRSLSSTRRGRSTNRSIQSTPRQKSTSSPRKSETPSENEKSSIASAKDDDKVKSGRKDDNKKEKSVVPQVSSIEESQKFVKDGKLSVKPPKMVKHSQVLEDHEIRGSLIGPQVVGHMASSINNNNSNISNNDTREISVGSVPGEKQLLKQQYETTPNEEKALPEIRDSDILEIPQNKNKMDSVDSLKNSDDKMELTEKNNSVNQRQNDNNTESLIDHDFNKEHDKINTDVDNNKKDKRIVAITESSADSMEEIPDTNRSEENNFGSGRKSSLTDSLLAIDNSIESSSVISDETDNNKNTTLFDTEKIKDHITTKLDDAVQQKNGKIESEIKKVISETDKKESETKASKLDVDSKETYSEELKQDILKNDTISENLERQDSKETYTESKSDISKLDENLVYDESKETDLDLKPDIHKVIPESGPEKNINHQKVSADSKENISSTKTDQSLQIEKQGHSIRENGNNISEQKILSGDDKISTIVKDTSSDRSHLKKEIDIECKKVREHNGIVNDKMKTELSNERGESDETEPTDFVNYEKTDYMEKETTNRINKFNSKEDKHIELKEKMDVDEVSHIIPASTVAVGADLINTESKDDAEKVKNIEAEVTFTANKTAKVSKEDLLKPVSEDINKPKGDTVILHRREHQGESESEPTDLKLDFKSNVCDEEKSKNITDLHLKCEESLNNTLVLETDHINKLENCAKTLNSQNSTVEETSIPSENIAHKENAHGSINTESNVEESNKIVIKELVDNNNDGKRNMEKQREKDDNLDTKEKDQEPVSRYLEVNQSDIQKQFPEDKHMLPENVHMGETRSPVQNKQKPVTEDQTVESIEKSNDMQTETSVSDDYKLKTNESKGSVSPLVKSESQNSQNNKLSDVLNIDRDQNDKTERKVEDDKIKSVPVLESKDNIPSDRHFDSNNESNANLQDKAISTNNSINKETEGISSSQLHQTYKDESGTLKVFDSPRQQSIDSKNIKANEGKLEGHKEKNGTPELVNKDMGPDESFKETENTISSVTNIIKGESVDHNVKTNISDFIQNEKQHVFVENSNRTDELADINYDKNELKIEKSEPMAAEKHLTVNANLNKHDQKESESHDKKESVKQKSQLPDIESNIKNVINSVINIVSDGPLDHNVKSYIGDFIQNEKQHVFIVKSAQVTASNSDLVKEINETHSRKQNIEDLSATNHGHLSTNINSNIQDSDKNAEEESPSDDIKHIINSTLSVMQTGQIEEIVKKYINYFLRNEKENVYISKQKTAAEEIKNDIVTTDDQLQSQKDINGAIEQKNKEQNNTNEKDKDKERTQVKEEDREKTTAKKNKGKEQSKLRRIKTVDVIRDESKNKTPIKSRIATADYRTRVKRDNESGKHSVCIMRSDTFKDNIILPSKADTLNTAVKSRQILDNKGKVEGLTYDLNKPTIAKIEQERDVNKSGEDEEKLNPTIKPTSDESDINMTKQIDKESEKLEDKQNMKNNLEKIPKMTAVTLSTNPYILEQEIINSNDSRSNKMFDISLKEISSAVKIQALWKGFKARKTKAESLNQKRTADETVTENHSEKRQLDVIADMNETKESQSVEKMLGHSKKELLDPDTGSQELHDLDRNNRYKLNKAAIMIQKFFRGFRTRKHLLNMKHGIHKNQKTEDQEIIVKRDPVADRKEAETFKPVPSLSHLDNSSETFIKAATTIQKIWRGFKTRKRVKQNDIVKTDSDKNTAVEPKDTSLKQKGSNTENQQVATNQTEISEAHKKYESSKPETAVSTLNEFSDRFDKAATTIQKIWRGFKVRRTSQRFSIQKDDTEKYSDSSASINKSVKNSRTQPPRGEVILKENKEEHLKTIKCSETKQLKTEEEFIKAAVLIQKIWRGFKIRNKLKRCSTQKDNTEQKSYSSASLNTSAMVAKSQLQKEELLLKETRTENLKAVQFSESKQLKTEDKFIKAAILIQKIWRGFKVRKPLHNFSKEKSDNNIDSGAFVKENRNNSKSGSLKEEVINKTKITENLMNQKSAEVNSSTKTEDEFVKAAILIQKIWKGFKVRNILKGDFSTYNTENINKEVKSETLKETVKSEPTAEETAEKPSQLKQTKGKDKFVEAAVLIQKVWRGFKVRNLLKMNSKLQNGSDNLKMEQLRSEDPKDPVVNKKAETEVIQKTTKLKQSNSEEFVKAAILIQKMWRGFKVRKYYKNNENRKTEETNNISANELENTIKSQISESNEQFIRAAIMIQKIWRGFKIRKVTQEKNLFGKRIETEQPAIETVKEIDPKDRKSALKIQSLWRGYKVRKNINVIKNKLEDKSTTSDIGKRKELTDEDILNAATKIQAGIRGYLQRKNYKTSTNKLKSISEEDCDEKCTKLISDETIPEDYTHDFNIDERKLSEEELSKALEALNKLEVPNDTPLQDGADKPIFYRSNTVQEPEIIRKHSPLLLKSLSDTSQNLPNKDDNNNNPDKDQGLSQLEMDVKDAIASITGKPQDKLIDEGNNLNGGSGVSNTNFNLENSAGGKKLSENASINNDNAYKNLQDNNSMKEELSENKLKSAQTFDIKEQSEQTHDLMDNGEKHENETSVKPSLANIDHPNVNHSGIIANVVTNKQKPSDNSMNERNTSAKDIKNDDDNIKTASHDGDKDNTEEKCTYDRPLSMDSNDSAVTVIYKEVADKSEKERVESNEVNKDKLVTSDKLKESLINDFQNKLLDQISGKNEPGEDTVNKFDIEQLRKELEEAGLIYNSDDNIHIRHDNSREILDDHDQLLDYLEGFELSTENGMDSSNLLSRDLPDIKEEDLETKSVGGTESQRSNKVIVPEKTQKGTEAKKEQSVVENNYNLNKSIPPNDLNVEKIKSTLRECEDIAREINLGFDTVESGRKVDNEFLHEVATNNEIQATNSDNIENRSQKLFCGTKERQIDNKLIPNDVEVIKQDNTKNINELKDTFHDDKSKCVDKAEQSEAENTSDDSSNQNVAEKSLPPNGLMHTGELHDSVVVPFSKESNHISKIMNGHENMIVELSPDKASEFPKSKLLHTGELHDTVVIPLPLRMEDNIRDNCSKTGIEKPVEDLTLTTTKVLSPSSDSKTNIDVKKLNSNSSSTKKLLHTGEMHDTLVVPLSIEAERSLSKDYNKSQKITEGDSIESTQNCASEPIKDVPVQSTKLLHTGELHDSVVIPLPKLISENTEDTDNGEESKSDSDGPGNCPRLVDSESQTNGDGSIAVQLNEVPGQVFVIIVSNHYHHPLVYNPPVIHHHTTPTSTSLNNNTPPLRHTAGVASLTSPRPASVVSDVSGVASHSAHTQIKGALPSAFGSDFSSPSELQSMESEKRTGATSNNTSMEVQAATKIQAGFRGYQVRKQLKLKNGSSDMNNQRRQLRRKSSGRVTESGRIAQTNKVKDPNEVEEKEKSAVKIQAGVRGFLVRRRQKKLKNQES